MRFARILISVAVTVAVAAAAGAAWALPGSAQTFAKGAPKVTTSASGPLFSLASMTPGHRASRVVTVRNTGAAPGRFELTAATSGSPVLLGSLRASVSVSGRSGDLYTGRLSRLHDVRLATLAPGETVSVRVEIELVSTGDDNRLQGLVADASFTWSASQR